MVSAATEMADTVPAEDPPAPVEEEPQNTEKEAVSPINDSINESQENRTLELVHNEESLNNMTKEELVELCKNSNVYLNSLETKLANFEGKLQSVQ